MDYDKLYGEPRLPPETKIKPLPKGLSTKETFKAIVPEAVDALRRVLNSPDASSSSVISAVTALLDRAEGKQAATADAGADNKLEITIIHQCPDCGRVDAPADK